MGAATSLPPIALAARIAPLTAPEAFTLLQTEWSCFLDLVESLGPDDWTKPTACTLWNVRDILAHQAGAYTSGTSYREMARQYTHIRPGRLPEDAINEFQLRERLGRSPADLIAELRQAGPAALHNWAYGFRWLKPIVIPHPIAGSISVRYIMWVTHSRDTWMHRLDICRATGRPFEQTRAHDGRINELVVYDAARLLRRNLGEVPCALALTGLAGGTWNLGTGTPQATVEMDSLDFNIYVSGRFSYEQALSRAKFAGDTRLAERALQSPMLLY